MSNKVIIKTRRSYSLGVFIIDAVFTVCTGGLWLIWVFCREMRN